MPTPRTISGRAATSPKPSGQLRGGHPQILGQSPSNQGKLPFDNNRREVGSFTSFYLYSLSRGIPHALRAPAWPRITRFDDRWRWLVTSVVPRFRRSDADTCLVSASLRCISDEARLLASAPCVLPHGAVGRL